MEYDSANDTLLNLTDIDFRINFVKDENKCICIALVRIYQRYIRVEQERRITS